MKVLRCSRQSINIWYPSLNFLHGMNGETGDETMGDDPMVADKEMNPSFGNPLWWLAMVQNTWTSFTKEILHYWRIACPLNHLIYDKYLEDNQLRPQNIQQKDLPKVLLAQEQRSFLPNHQHRSLAHRVLNVRHRMSGRGCSQRRNLIVVQKMHPLTPRARHGTATSSTLRRS